MKLPKGAPVFCTAGVVFMVLIIGAFCKYIKGTCHDVQKWLNPKIDCQCDSVMKSLCREWSGSLLGDKEESENILYEPETF